MTATTSSLADLETKAEAGEPFTRQDAERVLACPDLVSVGIVGEIARRRRSGDAITFGTVQEWSGEAPSQSSGRSSDLAGPVQAGEFRIATSPGSLEAAIAQVQVGLALAQGGPLTGFAAADLLTWSRGDLRALVDVAARLHEAGLEAVSATALDRFDTTAQAVGAIEAMIRGGLGVWRLTVERAAIDSRLDLAERAADIRSATQAVRAFAPLPRLDPVDLPSTGYDDVRTVAATRLICANIESIQVDWPLYGPKLAQVALTYGANDIDGVSTVDALHLGPRRAPKEDVARQIRAAGGHPVERNGRYERLS